MAKSKKTSDAFDMADDIRKEVAAESVADACSTSVPAIYSLAKGDNPRRAKYDKNADVIGYNLRLPANIHRLLKRHCMETNESMNNVVLVALYRDIRNRYASAVPDYGEDNVRAAGQAGTHSVQHPVIESGRTREQSDRNVEH